MSQWDYKIDQTMPGPFPFPNSRKGPGIEVESMQLCVWNYMKYLHGLLS